MLNVKWDINLITDFQLGVQKYGGVLPAVCRRGISLIVKAEHASMASSANSLGGFSFFFSFLFFSMSLDLSLMQCTLLEP